MKETSYETCKDCSYYYGEIDCCMVGEPDVSDDMIKKCEEESILTEHEKEICKIFLHGFECLALISGQLSAEKSVCIVKENDGKMYFTDYTHKKVNIPDELLKQYAPLEFNGLKTGQLYYLHDLVEE